MVKYPIFQEIAECTVDEFWIKVLNNCSISKFPQNSWYDFETTSFKIKTKDGKTLSIQLGDNNFENFSKLRQAFTLYLSLSCQSEEDRIREADKISKTKDLELLFTSKSWPTKSKKIQNILVNKFIDKESKEKSLKVGQMVQLKHTINFGLSEKRILPEDIILVDSKISNITSLGYDHSGGFYFLTREVKQGVRNFKAREEDVIIIKRKDKGDKDVFMSNFMKSEGKN